MKTESQLDIPNAGQSAHPFVIPDRPEPDGPFYEGRYSPGLTKLEDFAKAAMIGLLANSFIAQNLPLFESVAGCRENNLYPELAIRHATALLSELEKQKGLK